MCCQIEFSASGLSLVHGSPTECGVSECDTETPTMKKARPSGAVEPGKKYSASWSVFIN